MPELIIFFSGFIILLCVVYFISLKIWPGGKYTDWELKEMKDRGEPFEGQRY